MNNKGIQLVLLIALLQIYPLSVFSQTTKISGKVYDATTNEPLPYVSIVFKGTKTGVVTDENGNYKIDTYYATDTLVASFIGYKKLSKPVKKDKTQVIDFALQPETENLQEVVFVASAEDPAMPIWRNIIRFKDVNNREKLESYQYEVYNKIEFDLNNISEKFINKKLLKPIKFIFNNIDTLAGKSYLPVFITEAISDFYFRKSPKAHKEFIRATKVSGIENNSVSQFLGDMYQNINIYDNFVSVFGKNFVSPIHDRGTIYYKYFLLDSAFIGHNWCYKIRFVPKRKQEPTFIGSFWVNDTTYAIRKIECGIAEDANINFIKYFEFEQEYTEVQKEVWMLSRDYLLVDFKLAEKQMGFYGRKTTSYKFHVVNQPKEDVFYSGPNNVIVADDADKKTDVYWETARHDTLSESEKEIYEMMDTIQEIPQVKNFVNVISMLISGYKVWGYVEWGPYFSSYSFNPLEGPRVRIGGRTSNKFSKRFELNGYTAYGFKDERFKYGAGFRYMINKNPRQLLQFNYKHDVEQLGLSANAFRQDNLLAAVFRRNQADKLSFVDEYKIRYEYEPFVGLNTQLHYRNRTITPQGRTTYQKQISDNQMYHIPNVNISEFTYYIRWAKDERYISGEFDRVSMGTKKPVFDLQYSYGIKGFLGGDYEYHKIVVSALDWINVGTMGWFKYKIEGGKFFGTLPYPVLEIHRGNETYYYDEYSFNTMNFLEFASDQYLSAWATHHFDGFFLNHIPLLRRLKWREVAGIKAVWGSMSEKNQREIILPDYMYTLKYPFIEGSLGIENIFKVFRIDLVWRFNYLDHPNVPRIGIRGKFDVSF